MTATDVLALLPLVLIAATSVLVMVAAAVRRNHALALGITLAGLAAAFCSVFFVDPRQVMALLSMDSYALFFMGLIFSLSTSSAADGPSTYRASPADLQVMTQSSAYLVS